MSRFGVESDVDRLRAATGRHLGLRFDDSKLGFLGEALQRRVDALGTSYDAYLRRLEDEPADDELGALAREITVPESYFFRNDEQFRALVEHVVPLWRRADRRSRALRVLCAGCAAGEEAYSLAIALHEALGDPALSTTIRAVDINPAALEKARSARYSVWALRNTPPAVRDRWFRAAGREFVLAEDVRASVTFERANLAAADPDLWIPRGYDVIFFRNVMMYFTPEHMRAAVARAARALAPGGFLFLGHAETLRGYSDAFHLRHTHETFYYQLKDGADAAAPPAFAAPAHFAPAVAADAVPSGAWVDAIRASSDRVAALVPAAAPASAATAPAAPAAPWDVAGALDLLRKERFTDALAHVRRRPADAARGTDVLLLEAVLLAHAGETAGAESACASLLAIDELSAGAHHVLALCRESAGDPDGAAEEDRIAAYLDPTFAMPRLHLGLLARRTGDHAGARRELGQALALLEHEDASRLLLFGGGFTRAGLLALCESAVHDRGGRA